MHIFVSIITKIMKIRIKNNTIRYRLDISDIENLKTCGCCEEKTQIMDNLWKFSIKSCQEKPNYVSSAPFYVEIGINATELLSILTGPAEGIQLAIPNPDGSILRITIEKDFRCLVPRGEEDARGFEHPMEGKIIC
ncbi:hypothetical protein EDD80_101362 [Anseongella ginsenosidimutans]|uniref:Uncharacterized protein n=1 Tax=Anseongella ginsenosidimutans TaxID=496056 RepID=A0A4V2UUC3_9SPHI|nr:hypothetical protein [Anseongella ginsenosidimutans]QEC51166.1 hypothetical protein FRZ59_01565 [Anseongella ginsenosidimutans]TCS90163.1 hypothetical protein EDD80_101362 [Anseongella ginsenosidimutans]